MSSGYSRIEPSGVKFDYPQIDLVNKLVIVRVLFNGEVKMKVTIDIRNNTLQKEGDINDLASLTGISSRILNEQNILESFRRTAIYYLENNISGAGTS